MYTRWSVWDDQCTCKNSGRWGALDLPDSPRTDPHLQRYHHTDPGGQGRVQCCHCSQGLWDTGHKGGVQGRTFSQLQYVYLLGMLWRWRLYFVAERPVGPIGQCQLKVEMYVSFGYRVTDGQGKTIGTIQVLGSSWWSKRFNISFC